MKMREFANVFELCSICRRCGQHSAIVLLTRQSTIRELFREGAIARGAMDVLRMAPKDRQYLTKTIQRVHSTPLLG